MIDADFDAFETGDEVWFAEDAGDDEPQASTVHIVGKHHRLGERPRFNPRSLTAN